MAKMITKKYQNKNTKSDAYNKWYGRFIYTETLTWEEFIYLICKRPSPFGRETFLGVLAILCDCLVDVLLDSKRVQFSDLGTFYLSAGSEGEVEKDEFSADNVKKAHLRFLPNMKRTYRLDSKTLRDKASLVDIDTLNGVKKDSDDNPDDSNNG